MPRLSVQRGARAHQPVLGIPQPLLQLVNHVASVAARLPAMHGVLQRCGSTTMHLSRTVSDINKLRPLLLMGASAAIT